MTTSGVAPDKGSNAGVNEGFEPWRHLMVEEELELRTRFVGLLMNVLSHKFEDDLPNGLVALERLIHEYEGRCSKSIDDRKIGVTLLGMEDTRIKDHWIRNRVSLESTRTQHIDAQPVPMQLGATPRGKDKGGTGKDGKGKSKVDGKGKSQERESHAKPSDSTKILASAARSLAT